mgnify:CR=1 FL=1
MKNLAFRPALSLVFILSTLLTGACSVAETKTEAESVAANAAAAKAAEPAAKGPTIKIEPNSPADIVRIFYGHLREKRFREAIYLTNLRPAIEQLSDTELKDYQVDLENVARNVPSEIEINGEIVSGDQATVTARLPGDDPQKSELQEIRLRKDKNGWRILTVDEDAEKRIKEEGKFYLRNLRIETHQDEAKAMLDRIAKAQIAFAAQNGGKFAEMRKLVDEQLLPSDALSAETTGYIYSVTLTDGGAKYFATATPAEYGKSGVNSFLVRLGEKGSPMLTSKDNGGKPIQN